MQTNTSESLPRTIPELLENHTIQVQPQGYSMYPLFVPGRDSAVIEKADCDRLKKGDVILYRRENGILVLHRICRITKDGFYTVGDNQTAVEGPLTASQISGKLIHIIRNGYSFSVNHPVYRILLLRFPPVCCYKVFPSPLPAYFRYPCLLPHAPVLHSFHPG